jgi:hypothetical protein
MTTQHRRWLADVRRAIRQALLDMEFGRVDTAMLSLKEHYRDEVIITDSTYEVKNMIASLASVDPADLKKNPAMRAAAVRRLNETKQYIGEALLADTAHHH